MNVSFGEPFAFQKEKDVAALGDLRITLLFQGTRRVYKVDEGGRRYEEKVSEILLRAEEKGESSEFGINGEHPVKKFRGYAIYYHPRLERASDAVLVVQVKKTYPGASQFPLRPISELRAGNPKGDSVNTEGYVVRAYVCPPCPEGARCEPCVGDYVILSALGIPDPPIQSGLFASIPQKVTNTNELLVFANNPEQFDAGKKYLFSLEIERTQRIGKEYSGGTNDMRLKGYDEAN